VQPGVSGAQANVNVIGQQQQGANKIVAWSGVLEWQEVTLLFSSVNEYTVNR